MSPQRPIPQAGILALQGREDVNIFETDHWLVELADDQHYLGRCVVVARRPVAALALLTDEEWLDLARVTRRLERAVCVAFGAELCNWACLMNLAYRDDPPRPQVHWHVRPRYRAPTSFAGELWVDAEFGSHYARGTSRRVAPPVAAAIADALIEAAR
jgi:diadenosine tetraphosphate (Ap4A) HIT family hydrolase